MQQMKNAAKLNDIKLSTYFPILSVNQSQRKENELELLDIDASKL
jgi:hypothetical protein